MFRLPIALLALSFASLQAATPGRVVYARKTADGAELRTIRTDGSGDSALSGPTSKQCLFPSPSPDGKRIAFTGGTPGESFKLWIVNADGTGLRSIDVPERISAMPAWSPDGRRIAFAAANDMPSIYVVDVVNIDSATIRVTPEGKGGVFPFWSRDGKSVGYTSISPVDPPSGIVLRTLNGDREETLTEGGKLAVAGAGGLSPDGKRLAYLAVDRSAGKGQLCVRDLGTKSEAILLDLDLSQAQGVLLIPTPWWTADGKSLLVPIRAEKGTSLYRVSEDGKTRTRITPEGVDCIQGAPLAG
jgi:Tol biopolymer transport system component